MAVKADKEAVLATDPIVAPAADGDRAGRRRVLGSRKDPFKPQATPTPTPKPETGNADRPTAATPRQRDRRGLRRRRPSVGGSPAPDTGTPVVPEEEEDLRAQRADRALRRQQRRGLKRRDVKRLQALPSAGHPVLIYLGVLDDKKTAVFLLDSGVVAQGDGSCKPSRTTCETIHIREGETEFFDVTNPDGTVGSQYQLDVIKIRKKTTTNAKQAKAAKARVSKAGRQIVRARIAGDGPLRYRYDAKSGRLQKLSKKAYKAVVAKAARAARAHF